MIDYLYSASGVKLEVTHTTNKLLMVNSNIGNSAAAKVLQQTIDLLTIDEPALAGRTSVQAPAASNLEVQTTDYINGYILENGTLSQIQMNGGYMTEDSQGKAVYHFYLQDHQGNNRVVVNGKTLAVEQVNHYYPYGGLFAESTGGEMQAFKYNGKELDRVCGLNWYDHGARHNDAAIGRWHCIDPLAEKYYSISPYVYCGGDPVNCIDPTGCEIDSLAAAQMSDHIYDGEEGQSGDNWTCNRIVTNPDNGFKYGIYSYTNKDGKTEKAIVFCGSEPTDNRDWMTDIAQASGTLGNSIWYSQYGQAVTTSRFLLSIDEELQNVDVTMLGHSLGGGLATIASIATGKFFSVYNHLIGNYH